MTRDDIIRMAREAGFAFDYDDYPDICHTYMNVGREGIERFAAIVAAAEREACAQIADEVGDDDEDCHAWTAAAAIRARGQA